MPERTLRDPSPFADAARATTLEAFQRAAAAIEDETGATAWRDDDASDVYDAALLHRHTDALDALRARNDVRGLVVLLEEVLYRHQGELADPRLYDVSMLGTKRVVERFWSAVEAAIEHVGDPARTGLDAATTRARLERHAHVLGRTALLLSGGASLGFFHLGVVKTLHHERLLPDILSGASMGAMVACGVGARDDAELDALFGALDGLRTDALSRRPLREILRGESMYDPERLRAVIRHNNGDRTFAEAFAHSGRTVCVSVSPTRERQKPRILSHLTSPEITLLSAAVASSAVPGAFPPAVLARRDPDGAERPAMPTETWIDGTFRGDVPRQRLSRLFGVNHVIVSQVNPHVAPVRRLVRRRGFVPFLADAAVSSVRVRLAHDLGLARRVLRPTPLHRPLDLAHALVDQDYGGDIDIHPRIRPLALARTFSNISRAELEAHVLEGERATWPLLARVRDQTRIERALRRALARL